MKKIYLEEAIEAYRAEIDRIRRVYTHHYNRACNALGRGDARNYRKDMEKAAECTDQLAKLNKELTVIKTAYAAI